jgi:hypothetical protein
MILLNTPVVRWECQFCTAELATEGVPLEPLLHVCPGKAGFLMPMTQQGERVGVKTHEREDYIGNDIVRTDGEGRPIMATTITHDDSEDRLVYVPTATTRSDA